MDEFLVILKSLADETRFKIITLLLSHDFCVGALARRLNISEAAVSQHLRVLRKAGVVKGEKRGYYTHYWVDRETLKKVAEKIMEIASLTTQREGSCLKTMSEDCCCGKEG
ncbi:MAG: winged helix-turn-helix transcriptional regulator [Firmicutes bacterium]|nr:winged helix-turn-helix transcriptional regulator [Bacillota bacterium]